MDIGKSVFLEFFSHGDKLVVLGHNLRKQGQAGDKTAATRAANNTGPDQQGQNRPKKQHQRTGPRTHGSEQNSRQQSIEKQLRQPRNQPDQQGQKRPKKHSSRKRHQSKAPDGIWIIVFTGNWMLICYCLLPVAENRLDFLYSSSLLLKYVVSCSFSNRTENNSDLDTSKFEKEFKILTLSNTKFVGFGEAVDRVKDFRACGLKNTQVCCCFRKQNGSPKKCGQCDIMRITKQINKITRLTVPSKRNYWSLGFPKRNHLSNKTIAGASRGQKLKRGVWRTPLPLHLSGVRIEVSSLTTLRGKCICFTLARELDVLCDVCVLHVDVRSRLGCVPKPASGLA
ncbi:hypothetical protein LXL04_008898 [Taraxacum kok-saghyz]